jgi:hypothetical protein
MLALPAKGRPAALTRQPRAAFIAPLHCTGVFGAAPPLKGGSTIGELCSLIAGVCTKLLTSPQLWKS